MEILYGFIEYDVPRKGTFRITINEYDLAVGWKTKQEEFLIIGETDDLYVYRLLPAGHGEWIGDTVDEHSYILPIGIHKSRLIKWNNRQLELFNP